MGAVGEKDDGYLELRGASLAEDTQLVESLGERPYRARQLFQWVQAKGETSFACMSDLPATLRQQLAAKAWIMSPLVVRRQVSRQGQTTKYLLRLEDEETIETVAIGFAGEGGTKDRHTVCVSSQVGCALNCAFCATTRGGWRRNLTAGEIISQVHVVQGELVARQQRVTHLVFMGMGEPLLNYDAVMRAVELVTHPLGMAISARRITVSTCGYVPGIRRLAAAGLPLRLAVSLHAPGDEIRDQLVPINRRFPLAMLINALREYQQATGRRITLAYTMVRGVNDGEAQARQLISLVRGMLVHINLIPLNPVPENAYLPSPPQQIHQFAHLLEAAGIPVTVRATRGADISAACGQLRARHVEA